MCHLWNRTIYICCIDRPSWARTDFPVRNPIYAILTKYGSRERSSQMKHGAVLQILGMITGDSGDEFTRSLSNYRI